MLAVSSIITWRSIPTMSSHHTEGKPIVLPIQYAQRGDLVRCSLSGLEREFARNFPGSIETYRHGQGTVVFRSVYGATRKLHDSGVCLKSSGFKLGVPEVEVDAQGNEWKVYSARNAKNHVEVRSCVLEVSTGRSWASVEEWFWHAFFTNSTRGYLAITEINDRSSEGELY